MTPHCSFFLMRLILFEVYFEMVVKIKNPGHENFGLQFIEKQNRENPLPYPDVAHCCPTVAGLAGG